MSSEPSQETAEAQFPSVSHFYQTLEESDKLGKTTLIGGVSACADAAMSIAISIQPIQNSATELMHTLTLGKAVAGVALMTVGIIREAVNQYSVYKKQ
ncbi:MAG TPA: hypothetical protein PKB09_01955 [Candidatus Saccharibacteria bacterium]|nr:hypothetical protein [Candidatus Saccharibacteria bacterium]